MLATLRRLWGRMPHGGRRALVATGLPYAARFITRYREQHRIAKFAGNLERLNAEYSASPAEVRAQLSSQFDSIVDVLVMPNAVTKTTYANRLARSVAKVLAAVQLPGGEIRVLDVPSSTGIASLQLLSILEERYRVTCYVLGDKYHEILFDPQRRCIFDTRGNLLQVAFRRHFFSIYRGHACGNEHTFLSTGLLFPHTASAWYLRKRYRFKPGADYRRLLVVHPEVEPLLDQKAMRLQEMDVFQPIPERYELIFSFNLLQRNYFAPDVIQTGINNLAASLSEGGVLVMGNTESFVALQKQDGSLIVRLQEGSF
jgi:hypothetical protein